MKIGIDGRLWNETGVGRYIRNLVSELSKIDSKNQYVLFTSPKVFIELPPNWSIEKTDIKWHSIQEQVQMPKILNKYKLDLVHFPYFSIPIFYKNPYVITIHDMILHHFSTGEASTLPLPIYKTKLVAYKKIIKTASDNAQKIIAVSNATKQDIITDLSVPENKIVVIHEGFDFAIKESKKEYHLLEREYFLYVGNAYPHKNLDLLIKAFEKFVANNSSYQLVLVGKSDYFYQKLIDKISKTPLKNHITFLGEVTDDELGYLYSHAKALIIPSLMEGFGLPVLEAMARKCLVLASNIPAHKEVAGKVALFFNPHDLDHLVSLMIDVTKHSKSRYEQTLKIGAKRSKDFSWKEMAKQTLQVYESCVSLR